MYKCVLQNSTDHTIAFELATLYAQQQQYDQALMFFTTCIELARDNLLELEPTKLAEYYMHRSAVYEALGLLEHS